MNTNIMQYIISYTIIYLIYLELFIFKSPQYSSIIERYYPRLSQNKTALITRITGQDGSYLTIIS